MISLNSISLFFNTLKYLKWIQIKYRFFYLVRNKIFIRLFKSRELKLVPRLSKSLILNGGLYAEKLWQGNNVFCFLNVEYTFQKSIDWNFDLYGKLWIYNLNYFEFLLQYDMKKEIGLNFIYDFIKSANFFSVGLEPFPTSLRVINWIKFLSKYQINDYNINSSLYGQIHHLSKNIEYHLLGNHLLENGYAILIGGIYFNDNEFIQLGEEILIEQLEEQILADGGHFELSPMYHKLLLYRLLDCVNILMNNKSKVSVELQEFMLSKATQMLSWLDEMSYMNGDVPMFNDSSSGIAPSSIQLFSYASKLGIQRKKIDLKESGYRMISRKEFELAIDIGIVGPSYQPGHAHSDTFNFELRLNSKPFIVDTGISTYEKSSSRNLERSTSSHNTVQVDGYEQSEVWGGFRVARRAFPVILDSSDNHISAEHNGYQNIGCVHQRTFSWIDSQIEIFDKMHGNDYQCKAFIHFHPSVEISILGSTVQSKNGTISFFGAESVDIECYQYALGFNKTMESKKIIILFKDELKTSITW